MLLSLSRAMPQSINDMSSCIHPIPEIVRKYATDVLDLISSSSTLVSSGGDNPEEMENVEEMEMTTEHNRNDNTNKRQRGSDSSSSINSKSDQNEERRQRMEKDLQKLDPFNPIQSIDALHPMEIDASGSLSPMQKRHKSSSAINGKDMSLEEIYTFAGWIPTTWLDPSNSNAINSGTNTEAKVSINNANYQTSGLLPTTTPLGRLGSGGNTNPNEAQIEAIRRSVRMNTGGSTLGVITGPDKEEEEEEVCKVVPQDDAELIPRSMSDIYKISIQNRNKRDASKVNDENQTNDAVEDENFDDIDLEDDSPIFKSSKQKSGESDVEFMTRLGWVEQGTEMYGRVKRAEAQSNHGSGSSGSGGNGASGASGASGGNRKKDGDDDKRRRSKGKNRNKRGSASSGGSSSNSNNNSDTFDYGSAAGSFGAAQHGTDTGRLVNNINKGSSSGRERGRGGGKRSIGGGRGGRSFVGGSRSRSGGGSGGSGGGRGGSRKGGRRS